MLFSAVLKALIAPSESGGTCKSGNNFLHRRVKEKLFYTSKRERKEKKKEKSKRERLLNKTFPTLIKHSYFSVMPVCAIAGSDHRPVSQRPGSLGGSPEENHPMKMPKTP